MSPEENAPSELVELMSLLSKAKETLDDPRGLSRLLEEIRSTCSRKLGHEDALRRVIDSHDLGQDVLLALVRQGDEFVGSSWPQFWAFISRIIDNRILTLGRRHRTQKRDIGRLLDEEQSDALGGCRNPQPGPTTAAADGEDKRALAARIDALPGSFRDALKLRLAGASYTEIARSAHISTVASRKRVSRALELLRQSW